MMVCSSMPEHPGLLSYVLAHGTVFASRYGTGGWRPPENTSVMASRLLERVMPAFPQCNDGGIPLHRSSIGGCNRELSVACAVAEDATPQASRVTFSQSNIYLPMAPVLRTALLMAQTALHYVVKHACTNSHEIAWRLRDSMSTAEAVAVVAAKDRHGADALHHALGRDGCADPTVISYLLTYGVGKMS